MKVPKHAQGRADRVTREHPNHVVGSGRFWHWSYYHSGYGMADGWATSERAAKKARANVLADFVEGRT